MSSVYLGPYSSMSGSTAYVDLLTLVGWYERTQPNGNPSCVVFTVGATDGIELDVTTLELRDAVDAAGGDSVNVLSTTGVPWRLVRGSAASVLLGTSDANTATTLYDLGGAPVTFEADPTTLRDLLNNPPPAPSSPLVLVQGIILADGTASFAENFEVSPYVPGSGNYHIGLTEEAAGATGVPNILPFGAPLLAGLLEWSYTPTGPGEFDIFVRNFAGVGVDAPFGFSMVVRPVA